MRTWHRPTKVCAASLLPVAALVAPVFAVDYLTIDQAQDALFPGDNRFTEYPVQMTKDQRKAIKKLSGVRQRSDTQAAWKVQKTDGSSLGWVLIDEVIGKHEYITYAVALSDEGSVLGVEIMSYRETHGGEVKDQKWRMQFKGKTLSDNWKLDDDVRNLSGATLSCRNIMNGIKRLLAMQKVMLQGS